jgi:hypothetical protein
MPTNGKGRKDNALRQEKNPFLEHTSGYESVGESKREERDAEGHDDRHRVRIISKRVRICDPDNLVGGVKYLVDSLRAADIIPEDDPQAITLEVSQEKVKTYKEEETWVEVSVQE